MSIERLKGKQAPGDHGATENPYSNFTDINKEVVSVFRHEIDYAQDEMLKIPVKDDRG